MICYNRNLQEYKDLLEAFDSNMQVDGIISNWKAAYKSEAYPTVAQAKQLLKDRKILFSFKQQNFADAIYGNLSNKKLISKFRDEYYVNNSDRSFRGYDEQVLQSNLNKIKRYLTINNIPLDVLDIKRTSKSFRIRIKDKKLSPRDLLESSRAWDKTRSRHVVAHLMRLFPDISVTLTSVANAERYYNSLPKQQKANIKFDQVRSYFDPVANQVVLIEGRVTNETAIEEMLHPFVDSLFVDNADLFNGLLEEAKKMFPVLTQQINDSYSDNKGFTQKHRDLELVTQALTRHFNKEYEEQPTKTFADRIKQFIEWFAGIIDNLYKYITGKGLPTKTLRADMTLSDVAKMLNTSDIRFDASARADAKIRFSLTPELQATVDYALSQSNAIQQEVIKRLFHQATAAKEKVGSLAVGESGPIVVLNEADHIYYDVLDTRNTYRSTTERIKGKLSEDDLFNKKLNIDLGNDFDKLLQGITSDKKAEDLFPEMTILTQEQAQQAFDFIKGDLKAIRGVDGVAIPQVVVYDERTKTAGSIDILVVMPDGKLRIVDLKTSKNSINDTFEKGKLKGTLKYETPYPLGEASDLRKAGLNKELSTKATQGTQVNMYARMLENMGYTMDQGANRAQTYHIQVGVEGKDAEQKFTGMFRYDGMTQHNAGDAELYVDFLIPLDVNEIAAEEIEERISNQVDSKVDFNEELTPEEKLPDGAEFTDPYTEIEVHAQALQSYKKALVDKQTAIEQIRSKVFMDRTKEQTQEDILLAISQISTAMAEGSKARAKLYTEFLRDAFRQINSFKSYITDPKNFNKPEYITYALNFSRFTKTFEGLYSIGSSKFVNAAQRTLIAELQFLLNELDGKNGLVDQAIENYVKEKIKDWSSRDDLTEDVLNDLMKSSRDISFWELNTSDLDTSSDTLLAVMAKIYKAKKQELLDRVEERNRVILGLASRLQKLSPEKDVQKLYDFMLQFDEDGNFTGRYVKRLGRKYYKDMYDLRSKLFDENGNKLEYRTITDVNTARKEDIEYNVKLAQAKADFGLFFRAERVGLDDKLLDGEYHSYTEEFKKERAKYEFYAPKFGRPEWERKAGVSDKAWNIYRAKYYDTIEYTKALRDRNGNFTGATQADGTFPAVKQKYRVTNDYNTKTGERLISEKYEKIMNPTDALGQAQKDFYLAFVKYYEEDLLNKLPSGVRSQMLGRVPVVKGKVFQDLKGKPNIISKLWATATRSIKNLTSETAQQRAVITDEDGNLVDQLPVFYVGNTRIDAQLKEVNAEIESLEDDFKKGKVTADRYKKEMPKLKGRLLNIQSKPSLGELNKDMGTALLRFSSMAEHYETMSTVEDTYKAFIKVIEKREYQPADRKVTLGKWVKGKFFEKGKQTKESNVLRRARKWMSMIYYDNEQITKGFLEKVSDGLIQYSSLSYVAFNPFGNFNNYVLGRINNSIEALGQRFYSAKSYGRAEYEFNQRALPDLMYRMGSAAKKVGGKSVYDPELPSSKYEALVDLFRMMDSKSDLRETLSGPQPIKESYFKKFFKEFGYYLQDAAEYNVQTKVGMAMLIDTKIMNKGGDIISLYDAFEFNSETKTVDLKEGYDTIVKLDRKNVDENGKPQILKKTPFNDDYRYQLRNQIREVNKQIHGNYAREDRMVIESYAIGRLAAQFHKWVAPAIKARFRREYFDENLGWMEGRYRAFWKLLQFTGKKIKEAQFDFATYGEDFMKQYGYTGDGSQLDQRAQDKLFGAYRTLGELSIILLTISLNQILAALFADDDDTDLEKRLENFVRYQADRTFKELIVFIPLVGAEQQWQFISSPIASTRTLGELSHALWSTVTTPIAYAIKSEDEFYADSDYVYQRGTRAGQLKLSKEWADVVPIVYSIKKYNDFINLTNFYIK